jgi:hypothetical protein
VGVNSTDSSGVAAALAAAKAAASIVYVGGLDTATVEREGKDRYDVALPGLQPSLLRQLLALGKPTAVVLFHGGMVTLPPDLLGAPNLALVSAGYPGIYGAAATAAALFDGPDGRLASNRWGKTPVTWFSEAGWAAAGFNMLSFDMGKAPGRTHRYYTGEPQWSFGHGLGYAQTRMTPSAVVVGEPVGGATAISAAVHNADTARAADEVVFLYAVPGAATVPPSEPAAALRRQLVGFTRVGPIAPGGSAAATFSVTADDFRLVRLLSPAPRPPSPPRAPPTPPPSHPPPSSSGSLAPLATRRSSVARTTLSSAAARAPTRCASRSRATPPPTSASARSRDLCYAMLSYAILCDELLYVKTSRGPLWFAEAAGDGIERRWRRATCEGARARAKMQLARARVKME